MKDIKQDERNRKKLENKTLADRARLLGFLTVGQRVVFKDLIKRGKLS